MRRALVSLLLAAAAFSALAKVKVGENLLFNGTFDGDQVEFPNGWVAQPAALFNPEWRQSGGPGGLPSVVLAIPQDPKIDSRLREDRALQQDGLKLGAKGRFRIRAKLRATGFALKDPANDLFVIGVTDDLVEKTRGITSVPEGIEGQWKEVSAEIDGFPSKTGSYTFYVYVQHFTGTLEVADVRVEAADETAASETQPGFAAQLGTVPRIVPWEPLLGEIPETTREATFRFFGQLPDGVSAGDCDLTLSVLETGAKASVVLSVDRPNRLRVPNGKDEGVLRMQVVNRASGDVVVSRDFRYRIARVPTAASLKKHVRLNAAVTELLRERVSGAGRFSFGTARRGWVYLAVGAKSGAAVTAKLDGKVVSLGGARHETVREIPSGDHVLEVGGAAEGDEVVVRRIPEIYNYSPVNPVVKENGSYVGEFQERYVLPAVTSFDGEVRAEKRKGLVDRGYVLVDNMHSHKLVSDDDLYDRMLKRPSISDPMMDGLSLDEQHWYDFEQNARFMNAFRRFDLEQRPSKAFYTWIIGKPLRTESDVDMMSACANMAFGRGKLASEIYCRTKATEQEAEDYIRQYVCGTVRRYREMYPSIVGSLGAVLGNFNQWPVLSCCHHPEVDYRQYLDKQFNVLANDSLFDGLGLVGVWGSYYADRELHIWCFKLIRHYFIEGRTEMLSDAFGLKYLPGHVENGDFRGSLAPWAVDGNVSADVQAGLGSLTEARWGGNNGVGDTFAKFVRKDRPNALRQKLKGLTPGRRYYLQFITFDVDALKAGKPRVDRFGLEAVLGDGATVDQKASWVHVDRRATGRYGSSNRTTPNVQHIVFRTEAPEVELTFTDVAAKPGETLGLNAVGVYPELDD